MELLESENAVEAEKGEGEIVAEFEDELEANKLGNEGAALDEPANKDGAEVAAAGVDEKADTFKVELVGAADEDGPNKGEDAAAAGVVLNREVVVLAVELTVDGVAPDRGVDVVADGVVPYKDEVEVVTAVEPNRNGDEAEPNPKGAGEAEEVVVLVLVVVIEADGVKLKRVEEAELGFVEKARGEDEEEALKRDATVAVSEDVVLLLDPDENEKPDIFVTVSHSHFPSFLSNDLNSIIQLFYKFVVKDV